MSTTSIRIVLFDADGVVQTTPDGWLDDLKAFVVPGDGRGFVDDVFAAEKSAMVGERDFREVLEEIAKHWGLADRIEALLPHWQRIDVSDATVELVHRLRRSGIGCFLATNQQAFRASYMKQHLGFDDVFDGQFYSCELGVLKPDLAYFSRILERLDMPASSVLLVDDSQTNVEAARTAGLQATCWAVRDGIETLRADLSLRGLPA